MIVQIVILAIIAAVLGYKLYSVLGRRAEHEEEPLVPSRQDPAINTPPGGAPVAAMLEQRAPRVLPAVEQGVRAIAAADNRFDIGTFVEGAKGAYSMVLEAFWEGDRDTLRELCDNDVYASFDAAISAREEAGEVLDNRLVRIEEAVIDRAQIDGRMARIAVRFVADIAAVTRDAEGTVIAGSLDDAIESRDVWTFMRDVKASDPNWLLDETDEG